MTIELSQEEIDIIACWYSSASGEGRGAETAEALSVLDKLGIDATRDDLNLPNPEYFTDSYQSILSAQRAAIIAYRKRHPEMESVQSVEKDQPCQDTP